MKLLIIFALIMIASAWNSWNTSESMAPTTPKPTEPIPNTIVSYEAQLECTIPTPWCFRLNFYHNDKNDKLAQLLATHEAECVTKEMAGFLLNTNHTHEEAGKLEGSLKVTAMIAHNCTSDSSYRAYFQKLGDILQPVDGKVLSHHETEYKFAILLNDKGMPYWGNLAQTKISRPYVVQDTRRLY